MLRNAIAVRDDITGTARLYRSVTFVMEPRKRGAIIGHLNESFGSDENRKIALSWLLRGDPDENFSTNTLNPGEWYAVYDWLKPWHAEDGWQVRDDFKSEALLVLRYALRVYASRKLKVDPSGVVANGAALDGLKVISEQASE